MADSAQQEAGAELVAGAELDAEAQAAGAGRLVQASVRISVVEFQV